MKLLALTEPLFQLVCRVNRSARKGVELSEASVRSDLTRTLDELRTGAEHGGVADRLASVEGPVLMFIDETIQESRLPWAVAWSPLAEARGFTGGRERFFETVRKTLEDSGDAALDRLAVLYVCLGLGFTGPMEGKPDERRDLMSEIASRLRHVMDSDRSTRLVPEAYQNVDTSDLIEPPTRSVIGLAVLLAVLAVVVVAGNALVYQSASGELSRALSELSNAAEGLAAPGTTD